MGRFGDVKKGVRPPGKTLVLKPSVFADEWTKKPREAVCVGLRLMSEGDRSKARAYAEKLADELHPKRGSNWLDAFNDALVRQCAALGVCDPNDVDKPFELLPYAEEQFRFAVTSLGARTIFDAIQQYERETSQLTIEVSADELEDLALLLQTQGERLSPSTRRLLRSVLDELLEAESESEAFAQAIGPDGNAVAGEPW